MAVGLLFGYLPPSTVHRPTQHDFVVLLITISVHPRLLSRFGMFGRRGSIPAIVTFALCNGICETALFLASYDLGYNVSLQIISSYYYVPEIVGFTSFCAYSALIHAMFWLPHGFPRHVLKNAPPFHQKGLPELVILSMAWIYLYAKTGDIVSVCGLHILTDACAGVRIGLESPF